MSGIVKFDFQGHQIRVIHVDGHEEWIAKDVCEVLELRGNTPWDHLDDDEKGTAIVGTPSGSQQMTTITEAGLYKLILRSRKPQAKTFSRWVTHEVLPQIRRTGAYVAPGTQASIDKAAIASIAACVVAEVFPRLVEVVRDVVAQSQHPVLPIEKVGTANNYGDEIRAKLRTFGRNMAQGAQNRKVEFYKWRTRADRKLRRRFGHDGVGASWDRFPLHQLPELMLELSSMISESEQVASTRWVNPQISLLNR